MNQKRNVYIFENTHTLTNALVQLWTDTAQQVLLESEQFTAALSGGKTPVEFYTKLSGSIDFYLCTEIYLFISGVNCNIILYFVKKLLVHSVN